MEIYDEHKEDNNLIYRLENIELKKKEIKRLLGGKKEVTPYIIELSDFPRLGKSFVTERLTNFFVHDGISVLKKVEPIELIGDTIRKKEYDSTIISEMDSIVSSNKAIVIKDGGVMSRYFMYQMLFERGAISALEYEKLLLHFADNLLMMDRVYVIVSDPVKNTLSKYLNSFSKEDEEKERERVKVLKYGLDHLLERVPDMLKSEIKVFNTPYENERDLTIDLADEITSDMIRKLKR